MSVEVPIREYVPGSIGRLVELHGRYYARDWRFGRYFEAKVASAVENSIEVTPQG